MTVWEELKARGLIAQVTDEDEIKEMVNNGKATFYIGFDPTADSHLQSLHQAKSHEVTYMKAVCCRVESDVKYSLSIINEIADTLLICYLGNQPSCY